MAAQTFASDFSNHQVILQNYVTERDELFSRSHAISVSEMATTLAHELNQPLGTISNILHGLRARIETGSVHDAEVGKALDMAVQQTRFAARLITQIREFTDSFQPHFVELDVSQLLSRSIALLDFLFSTENVVVRQPKKPADKQFLAMGDFTMLQQIITNLLRNAVEAMRNTDQQHKYIEVSVSHGSDHIKIEIKDNGQGISVDSDEWLFTPFVTTKQDGMGVGLSICKSLVELHQGQLWITPNNSVGCTAHLLLPLNHSQKGSRNYSRKTDRTRNQNSTQINQSRFRPKHSTCHSKGADK